MVSCTAFTSNTPGRAGMMTMVAFLMASSTTADRFGGASISTHSIPSRRAAARIPLTELTAVLIGGSLVPRNLCQSVNDPCGSASTSRHGFVALICAARWAARVLFPEPPFRDAKTITFIPLAPRLTPGNENESRKGFVKEKFTGKCGQDTEKGIVLAFESHCTCNPRASRKSKPWQHRSFTDKRLCDHRHQALL